MSLVIATNVSKTYISGEVKVEALKELSFKIEPASFVSFVGPSGSGKTTILNLIGCLDKPTNGELVVAANNVSALDRRAAAAFRGSVLGFIFQAFNLFPVLTAFENIEYPLVMIKSEDKLRRKKNVSHFSFNHCWRGDGDPFFRPCRVIQGHDDRTNYGFQPSPDANP